MIKYKLIVHIGAGKCGSSAIQGYLRINAPSFRAQGVLIPGADLTPESAVTGAQVAFFQSLLVTPDAPHICYQPTTPEASSIVMTRLAALRSAMERNKLHTLILSAENLSNEHAFSHLLAQAKAFFDVHIVAYVRRQDEYLSSSWGQWYVKMYPNIDAYLAARVPLDGDWYEVLRAWRDDFGENNVHVRLFDRSYLFNGDVVDDFLKVARLSVDSTHTKVGRVNESYDERLVALASRVQDSFASIHDASFFQVMTGVLDDMDRSNRVKPYLFDFKKRREIMAAYYESNERLRSSYFSDMSPGTPLFAPLAQADAQSLSAVEKMDLEISMLTRIVYAFVKQTDDKIRS